MKQQTNIQTTAESRNRNGIKDAISVAFRTIIRIQNKLDGGGINIFLVHNKGKGPPGRVRSPGAGCCLEPDNHPVALKSSKNYYKTKFQHFNKYQISNFKFFKQLNFTIMKKQIFILIVALFAATTSFGQMVHNSAPIPLVCTTDATHPLAGVPYNYKVLIAPAGNFQWWATKDVDFIKTTAGVTTNNSSTKLAVGAAADLLATSVNYGAAASATDNVDITWSSAALVTALTTPTFVVVQADATGTNCSNNLKVYKITPVNGFTVDIKNMTQAKVPVPLYTDPISVCVADIESAKYDAGTSAIVTNYGTNVLYYEVVASNFTGGYTPYFQVTGLAAGQTVTSLELAVATTFATPIATTLAAGAYSPAAALTVDPSVTNTSTGVSIYVRLTIANGTHEHLADAAITLAVNGTNTAAQKDVVNTTCATQTDYEDTAVQTITKRPTVTTLTTSGAFVTP